MSKDLERDFYLSADEAIAYGLIDKVLLERPSLSEKSLTGTKSMFVRISLCFISVFFMMSDLSNLLNRGFV